MKTKQFHHMCLCLHKRYHQKSQMFQQKWAISSHAFVFAFCWEKHTQAQLTFNLNSLFKFWCKQKLIAAVDLHIWQPAALLLIKGWSILLPSDPGCCWSDIVCTNGSFNCCCTGFNYTMFCYSTYTTQTAQVIFLLITAEPSIMLHK